MDLLLKNITTPFKAMQTQTICIAIKNSGKIIFPDKKLTTIEITKAKIEYVIILFPESLP
jgi:hypothetical protein